MVTSTSTIPVAIKLADEKIQKKNDLKAISILMMTLPSEHLLIFNQYKEANTLFEAIEARFGDLLNRGFKRSVISSSNSSSQNVAFVSTPGSTNDVNTSNVHVSTASSSLSTTSTTDNTARLNDAIIYAFLANQLNGSHVVHEDLEQIHEDDLEEMDLKWPNWPLPKTPTKFSLKAFSDSEIELNKSEFDLANYKRGLASVEEQLVLSKKNEGMLCDQIVVLKRDASFNESEINALKIQIERLKKEKESNQIKIDNFENASKSLDKLI
ncbi:hypothetical protein Tco_0503923, partial [Tanacetum coccineum]